MDGAKGLARRVALTFDVEHPDRPHWQSDATDRLLDLLAATGVRATFFVQGRWAEACPATARRIAADGHVVGNHSFFHASLPLLSEEGLVEDVGRAESAIRAATGVDPRPWFRFPFGDGSDDPGVVSTIERLGYRHVGWDVDSKDWEPGRTAHEIETAIVECATSRPTCVALLHGWPSATVPAVAAAIEALRLCGLSFVAVDQLADHELPKGLPVEPEDLP
jgi:peptidoglycan/xylan/chitin deacetylase (PgdA/CDA1 family)